jgi:DMSO/TMAO reductase YedYZ heme-binding membrane subunit
MNSTMLWYTTRATGIVALVLLSVTMVLGLVTTNRPKARNWPGFLQQEMHRRISMMAVAFVAIHILSSILDTFVSISWWTIVVPFASSYGRFWIGVGTISLDLMIAVFVSSLLRSRMNPGAWRAVHWLAYVSWPVAVAHTFGIGTDAGEPWVILLTVACMLSVGAALLWRLQVTSRHTRHQALHSSPSAARSLAPAVTTRGPRHDR